AAKERYSSCTAKTSIIRNKIPKKWRHADRRVRSNGKRSDHASRENHFVHPQHSWRLRPGATNRGPQPDSAAGVPAFFTDACPTTRKGQTHRACADAHCNCRERGARWEGP